MLLVVARVGLRALRFVTLLPVILALTFLLRIAAPAMDYHFSARPLARETLRLQPNSGPVAAWGVSRELEYGLGFYLNRPVARYDRGEMPAGDHLLIAPAPPGEDLARLARKRRFTLLGQSCNSKLSYFWVTAGDSTQQSAVSSQHSAVSIERGGQE
jgi:hypothetical protein